LAYQIKHRLEDKHPMTFQAPAVSGHVRRRAVPLAVPLSVALALFLPLGCGTGIAPGTTHTNPLGHALHGKVFGGQQPIISSQVYLYAAGTSTSGSRSMLSSPGYVVTDNTGSFNITGDYTCTPGDQVYLAALGGDAGGGPNPAIGLLSALGPCSGLSSATYLEVNEVTTVATAFALSSFITSPTSVGSDPVGSNAVAAAFANVKTMTDVSTGLAPTAIIGSGIVPQATIYSLANSIAGCVNSSLISSTCSTLFSYTGTSSDSNTAQAAINIAHSPATHAADIYALAGTKPPFEPTLQNAPDTWAIQVLFPADVLTYKNNNARNGVQSAETVLTTSNVNAATFGKLYTFPIDGYLYAQPLIVGGLGMPDGALHNVVYAATAHGTIYAFDADGNNPSAGYLWKQSLFASGETSAQTKYLGFTCGDIQPEFSIIGTPVIDRSTGTMYVVSKEMTSTSVYTQKIHAISLIDGSEKFGGPTLITATYPGTGDGAVSGTLTFDPLFQNQRPALLLANGTVWITWASHCDKPNYHGYVIGYSAADVTQQTVLFNNTPNGSDGGIWMSGGGPSADAAGYVYTSGGNGTFDVIPVAPAPASVDYGDSTLKLSPPTGGSTLPTVADYFTPYNQATLSSQDHDVGMTNPMLFDDPGSALHLLVETDKTGRIYLLDTAAMGTYTGPNGTNADIQDFVPNSVQSIFNNLSYFQNTLFVGGARVPLRAYAFLPGTPAMGSIAAKAGKFNTNPTSYSSTTPGGVYSSGGMCPMISANGTDSGIVWGLEHTGATGSVVALRAYDATDLATELYDTTMAANNADQIPAPVKFSCPVVANGHVFVGGQTSIAVYGILP
jgi:hypothetical protein